MDFMNRGFRNSQNNSNTMDQQTTSQPAPVAGGGKRFGRRGKGGGDSFMDLKKAGGLTFLIALVIIVAGVIFAMINFKGDNPEAKLVDTSKYQAVFLNGGQVYFGHVKDLNSKYLKLDNIYYLRVNQQVQPDGNAAAANSNDVSLVKLGCELHGPQDSMVVNRDQIVFWENLKGDGQVLKAIDQYKQQYPNGEDCSKQGSSTPSTDSGNSTTTPTPTTTPSTTPGTTKPTTR